MLFRPTLPRLPPQAGRLNFKNSRWLALLLFPLRRRCGIDKVARQPLSHAVRPPLPRFFAPAGLPRPLTALRPQRGRPPVPVYTLRLGGRRRQLSAVISSAQVEVTTVVAKTLLTLTSTGTAAAYELPSAAKLSRSLLVLTARLLRRFLACLGVRRMRMVVDRPAGGLLPLWRALASPLDELFPHPCFLRFVGDLSLPVAPAVPTPLGEFFAKQRQRLWELLARGSEIAANEALLEGQLRYFNFLWLAWCCSFLRLAPSGCAGRSLQNYWFTSESLALLSRPGAALTYRRRLRSVRRRTVKRFVRETARRLWVF